AFARSEKLLRTPAGNGDETGASGWRSGEDSLPRLAGSRREHADGVDAAAGRDHDPADRLAVALDPGPAGVAQAGAARKPTLASQQAAAVGPEHLGRGGQHEGAEAG